MLRSVFRALFHRHGWQIQGTELSQHRRAVVVAAPHTSNWDMVYALATFDQVGLPVRFTIKREWLRFPFSLFLAPLGAIGIDRRPRSLGEARPSMVEAMVRLFEDNPGELAVIVTPEGTRSPREEWRTGFYHVARAANVPILLGYLDYQKRASGIGKVIWPTGDVEADMREIMDFYRDVAPRYPENFRLDHRYSSAEPPPANPSAPGEELRKSRLGSQRVD